MFPLVKPEDMASIPATHKVRQRIDSTKLISDGHMANSMSWQLIPPVHRRK